MYINNKSINDNYNAELLSRLITPSDFEVKEYWGTASLSPIIFDDVKFGYKSMKLVVEFKGSENEIAVNKSRLLSDIIISDVNFKALENTFKGYVVNTSIKDKVRGFETLEINMNVIEESREIKNTFNTNTTIILSSTLETPCILKLEPAQDIGTLTITGLGEDITIINLKTGKEIIIDGVKGIIKQAGENNFSNYDSWGFPYLNIGENNITLSENIKTTLTYKPRWK